MLMIINENEQNDILELNDEEMEGALRAASSM